MKQPPLNLLIQYEQLKNVSEAINKQNVRLLRDNKGIIKAYEEVVAENLKLCNENAILKEELAEYNKEYKILYDEYEQAAEDWTTYHETTNETRRQLEHKLHRYKRREKQLVRYNVNYAIIIVVIIIACVVNHW